MNPGVPIPKEEEEEKKKNNATQPGTGCWCLPLDGSLLVYVLLSCHSRSVVEMLCIES
jgi:hypothetical protein